MRPSEADFANPAIKNGALQSGSLHDQECKVASLGNWKEIGFAHEESPIVHLVSIVTIAMVTVNVVTSFL